MTIFLVTFGVVGLIFLGLVLIRFHIPSVILMLVFIRPFVEAAFDVELIALGGYKINPMSLWGALSILLSIWYWIVLKRNPFEYAITKWIALFLLSLSGGFVTGTGFEANINQASKIMSWILLIPVVIDILRHEAKETLFKLMYTALVVLLLTNIILFATGYYNTGYYGVGEFYGYFKGPFGMGFTILFLLPFALCRVRQNSKSVLPWLVLLASFGFITFTYVRTTWVALLVGALTFLYLGRQHVKRILPAILLAVVCFIGVSTFKGPIEPAFEARTSDFQEYRRSGNIRLMGSGRFAIWTAQLEAYANGSLWEQLFGRGFGIASVLTSGKLGVELGGHNDYIDLLTASGLVSTVFYLVFQFQLLRGAYRLYKTDNLLIGQLGVAVMVTMITVGLLSGIIYSQSCVYIAVFMGMVLHLSSYSVETPSQFTCQKERLVENI